MNKSDLIDRVASTMGITRGESAQYVDIVLDTISDGLIEDGRVKITGFGSFIRRHRSARDVTKPSTGEPITIPASETCGFKAAPALRQKLTEGVVPAGQVEPKPMAHEAVREAL